MLLLPAVVIFLHFQILIYRFIVLGVYMYATEEKFFPALFHVVLASSQLVVDILIISAIKENNQPE